MKKRKDKAVAFLLAIVLMVTLFAGYEREPAKAAEPINSTQAFRNQFVAECLARVGNKYETGKGHTNANSTSFDCGGLIGSALTAMGFSKGFDGNSWGYWGPEQWRDFVNKLDVGEKVELINNDGTKKIVFRAVDHDIADILKYDDVIPAGSIVVKEGTSSSPGNHAAVMLGYYPDKGSISANVNAVRNDLVAKYGSLVASSTYSHKVASTLAGILATNKITGNSNNRANLGWANIWDWRQRAGQDSTGTNTSGKAYNPYWLVDALNPDIGCSVNNNAFGKAPVNTVDVVLAFEEYGDVSLNKVDQDGNRLAGAEISIFRTANDAAANRNPIQTITSSGTKAVSFTDLTCTQQGTVYYIRETKAPAGYVLNNTVFSVNVYPDRVTPLGRNIVNTLSTGSLLIQKTVTGSKDGTFYFKIEGPNSFSEIASVTTINRTGEVLIDKLRPGDYTVTEIADANGTPIDDATFPWKVTSSAGSITVTQGNTATVAVTNEEKVGDLTIFKKIVGTRDDVFYFLVTGPQNYSKIVSVTTQGMEGSVTLEDLPIGDYYVSEVADATGASIDGATFPYKVEVNKTGALPITTDQITEVIFTNTEKLGSLTITKVVEGISDDTFYFKVTGPYGYENVVSITTSNKQGSVTINSLPLGAYTVEEVADSTGAPLDADSFRYDVAVSGGNTVNITLDGEGVEKEIVNTEKKGILRIEKSVPGAEGEDTFYFHIYGGPNNYIDKVVSISTVNGVGSYSEEVYPGNYTVTEVADEMGTPLPNKFPYTVSVDGVTTDTATKAVAMSATTTYTFVNDPIKSPVRVTKVWDVLNDSVATTVTVQLLRDGVAYGEAVKLSAENNWTYTWDALPHAVGGEFVEYTIKEIDVAGFSVELVKDTNNEDFVLGDFLLTNTSSKVRIIKIDAVTNLPLAGARLQIIDKNNHVVHEWVTDNAATFIEAMLEPGETYTLHEVEAPLGYLLADDVEFTVSEDGEVVEVEMVDDSTKVYISKTDIVTGEEIAGATLQIIDKETNELVMEWVTDGAETLVEAKLKAGKTYILKETASPQGYIIANEVEFTVSDDGTIDRVEMEDGTTKVLIKKTDIVTGAELAGATMQILTLDGVVVHEWVTDGNETFIESRLTAGESYILRELIAPIGYIVANEVIFNVSEDGTIDRVEMVDDFTKVYISKQDLITDVELAGATLQIKDADGNVVMEWITDGTETLVEAKLEAGKTYYLTEIDSPTGYIIAQDVQFTVSEDGTIDKIVMKDAPTRVEIEKVDESDKPLAGAVLEIKDLAGNVIDRWTSDGSVHYVTAVLEAGQTYILHEVSAPEGFEKGDDVRFTVSTDGSIDKVKIKNHFIVDLPTGDSSLPIACVILIILVALGAFIAAQYAKKRMK